MNKIISRIAIALASFAMVVGGVSATAIFNNKEQAKPVYAAGAESISLSYAYRVYVDYNEEITATPKNFTPASYTWTSSNESVATVTWVGNVCTVHGVSEGSAIITVSAQGTNGTVSATKYVSVEEFFISPYYDEVEAQPCSYQFANVGRGNGSYVVYEATSDNPDVASIVSIDNNNSMLVIATGPYENASATITVTGRNDNGAPGRPSATCSFTVHTTHYYTAGNRITTLPEDDNETPVLLANKDKTKFVYVNLADNQLLYYTDDIRYATLFSIDNYGRLRCSYYPDFGGGDDFGVCGAFPFYGITSGNVFDVLCFDEYFHWGNYHWDEEPFTQLFVDYPGILSFNDIQNNSDGYMAIVPNDNRIMSCTDYPSNGTEPLFAYEAANERIVPEATSRTAYVGSSFDVKINTMLVDSLTYEVTSGEECLDDVDVSNITANVAYLNILASNIRGTAVIRVKDANDDSVYVDITVNVMVDAETEVGNILTQTSLAYHYSKDELGNFTYSNASIRFGGKINKDLWNEIDEDYDIAGFGVMITGRVDQLRSPAPAGYTISDHVADAVSAESATNLDTQLVNHYMSKAEMAVPPESGDDYTWNLMQSITINDASDVMKVYTAAAYIKLDNGDYLFFEQVETSVFSLVYDYLNGGGYNSSSVGGSLQNLLDMTGQE